MMVCGYRNSKATISRAEENTGVAEMCSDKRSRSRGIPERSCGSVGSVSYWPREA